MTRKPLIDQTDTQIIMKVMQSGRQVVRRLIIFRRTCTLSNLFWAYSYAGPSNFGRFGHIFWRIIRPFARYSKSWRLRPGELVLTVVLRFVIRIGSWMTVVASWEWRARTRIDQSWKSEIYRPSQCKNSLCFVTLYTSRQQTELLHL